ncbi:pyridoxine 5'-phosphate synthase [Myxococcota bacterium]|nr:pyridoxine 5'-phosphate synthase [Myxococcota bacterium]MBU1382060.1 pyridoxine 5'-phosphate synthase [Myxococcota bacterium]MBU1495562.1 pyridoxine 5'-phosphate synthase [Myxococcota bacterium]
MNNIRLHVNVDHIATLRNQRNTKYPDPVQAAFICEMAGAHGITVHLREDRRHIMDRDVEILRKTIQTIMNLEMAATDEMVGIACTLHPDIVTLVPEKREEKTTEGGLAVLNDNVRASLKENIKKLRDAGIKVSLFIDPEIDAVNISKELNADIIELHTGDYCNAATCCFSQELLRLEKAANEAAKLKLTLAAGHGLDYVNVKGILHLKDLKELNIGHSIISRAAICGLEFAVKDMLEAISE